MTIDQFLQAVEGYYGQYRPQVRPVVEQWLRSQRPGTQALSRLFAELVQTQTSQYRTPPDVAIMKPMIQRLREEVDHERMADLTRLSLPDPADVVDPSDARGLVAAIADALVNHRDPRSDDAVRSYFEKYGVEM